MSRKPSHHGLLMDLVGRLEKKTVVKKQTNVVRTIINHPANHHKELVFEPFPNG